MTRKWISLSMLGLLLLVPLVAIGAEGRAKKKRVKKAKMVKIRKVASVDSLMVGQRMMLGEISKTVNADPTAPKNLEKIAHLSELLAEFSNLNSVGKNKEAAYRKFARSLRDDSLKLRDEAKAEPASADKMLAALTQLKSNCKNCHAQYR